LLRTLLAAGFVTLYILVVAPWFVLHSLWTRSAEKLYRAGVTGARMALRLAGIRVVTEGVEKIPPGVCIFVGNHTSNVDPPVVVCAIPRQVAMLSKKEVFQIPILGTAMRLARFVSVDRASRDSAIQSVERAISFLRAGVSYLIFPEGTRSADGRLRPFKKGPFVMAIRARVPIVPVSVVGAHRAMPKGSWAIRPGTVRVVFHPPVDASGFTLDGKEALLEGVHKTVASALPPEQLPQEQTTSSASEP
jgi:1-acyl-sn-glycerol-3-phosphate acyltransferase